MDFDHKLLEYLVQEKLISQQVADEIRLSSINTGNSSSEILLQKHLIDEDKLLAAKSKIYHVPMMSLAGRGISPEILTFIPEPVARKYKLIPFDFDKKTNKLSLALTDPLDLPLLEFLELKSGKSIVAYISREDEISSKIDEVYSQGLASEVTEALKDTSSGRINTVDVSQISQIIKEAPIAKIVSTILEYAVKSRASDIHIEPQESRTRVRYRIDGILHERLALPRTVNDAVVSRIKILSDMKID